MTLNLSLLVFPIPSCPKWSSWLPCFWLLPPNVIIEPAVLALVFHSVIIQSVNNYLLSTYSTQGTVLGAGNAEMIKTNQVPTFTLHLSPLSRMGEVMVAISEVLPGAGMGWWTQALFTLKETCVSLAWKPSCMLSISFLTTQSPLNLLQIGSILTETIILRSLKTYHYVQHFFL